MWSIVVSIAENADEFFERLDNGASAYFCGLKGMMPGIQAMLKGVAESKGLEYDEWLKGLKKKPGFTYCGMPGSGNGEGGVAAA